MKLSTRGRYGIHAMFDLALYADEGPQSVKAIAERQGIPEAYLEQLFAALKRAELVVSTRGFQGGYVLAKPPEATTVGDVLRALEGNISLAACLDEEDACERACHCPSRVVWQKLRDGMTAIVDGITLRDMIEDHKRLSAQEDITT